MSEKIDSLFRDPMRGAGPFRFDQDVVDVFPDMIRRSVPGYETVVAMSGLLAGRFARNDTSLYDLGCSLGATLLSMRHQVRDRTCRIIGIDNSAAMLKRCELVLARDPNTIPVTLLEQDVNDVSFETASVVASNYTLQFIPQTQRTDLLARVFEALTPGGVFILSEKVLFEDEALQRLNVDLHHDFKRAHGYSELEIAGKRDSLENVLVAETLVAHRERLHQVGFSSCDVWFQCFNFASMIAIK
ncbi:MAG: carboxy-S-adenosyl-L-methionine synthase CmoA [Pseudomonadota bacterium]